MPVAKCCQLAFYIIQLFRHGYHMNEMNMTNRNVIQKQQKKHFGTMVVNLAVAEGYDI